MSTKLILFFLLSAISAIYLLPRATFFKRPPNLRPVMTSPLPMNQSEWKAALDSLPSTPDNIPAFFYAHGSPALAYPEHLSRGGGIADWQGPKGPLANFLKDFGPVLLQKYKPRGIVVFSAHWETLGERLVTDYGSENPLLMDYFGFPAELYKLKFRSKGDSGISQRIVQLYKEANYLVRTTTKLESRGDDGRGFEGPGLDHGVFVPFRYMFGEEFMDTPIIQVSIDSSMSPEANWKLGKTVAALREEGILVLSGGLPIHNLRDFSSFDPNSAKPIVKDFDKAILDAVTKPEPEERKQAMFNLTKHPGFRAANPREEHFVPLYIAAGAAETGKVKVLNALYGIPTIAFGL
ncbi:related to 4,5-DOPA dioxygenase extradiol-like protein [Armillaria ostoyae]|uniref:Related to 4,5-DOPA dioxygenase extradiol-like protein n=1 Tax=Armillaria ostoyae TaxID=47428 RepID=A0A284R6R5_ARMOS|nr:related to 4,5-DOPA dioxygenase extradiol-like protein [Armillaria ostoyae]